MSGVASTFAASRTLSSEQKLFPLNDAIPSHPALSAFWGSDTMPGESAYKEGRFLWVHGFKWLLGPLALACSVDEHHRSKTAHLIGTRKEVGKGTRGMGTGEKEVEGEERGKRRGEKEES